MENKIIPYTLLTAPHDWNVEKWHEYVKVISSFTTFTVSNKHQQWILTALHDDKAWNWYQDCNGANVVSEPGWNGKYSPPYIYHDYAWMKYGPTMKSNNRMKELQDAYGMDGWRSNLRWFGVTAFGMPVHATVRFFKGLFGY
jgi:hypothetical protein